MKQRLLITGGTGFIGRNLIETLSDKYAILSPNHKELDLTDSAEVYQYIKLHPIDVVIHCSNIGGTKKAVQLPDIAEINLRMFINVLRCKKYYKKMIYFGSGAEYDKSRDLKNVKEEEFGMFVPVDSYGFYKYVCSMLTEKEKNVINLRLFGVYGKYEDFENRFISYAICRTLLHKPVIIQKNVMFDYLYIRDLIQIVDYFIQHNAHYSSYNVGHGIPMDLAGIAHQVLKLSPHTVPIRITGKGLNKEYGCDITRLKKEIKNIRYTDFNASLEELREYYGSIMPVLKHNINLRHD